MNDYQINEYENTKETFTSIKMKKRISVRVKRN